MIICIFIIFLPVSVNFSNIYLLKYSCCEVVGFLSFHLHKQLLFTRQYHIVTKVLVMELDRPESKFWSHHLLWDQGQINLSKLQFPHLWNGNNKSTISWLFWRWNDIMHIKCLRQYLAQNIACVIFISPYYPACEISFYFSWFISHCMFSSLLSFSWYFQLDMLFPSVNLPKHYVSIVLTARETLCFAFKI